MKAWLAARDRGLFIRSYAVLAGGLLAVAILLDLGFDALQSRQARAADPWLESTFRLIEHELARVAPEDRAAAAANLAARLKLQIEILDTTQISGATDTASEPRELEDADGRVFYLWASQTLHGAIRIGPFEPVRELALVRFLPVFFYGSILLIVGFWLRPLLRDLRLLTRAAQRFAGDYREPLETTSHVTQLKSLASNLDDMSAKVSQLIQSQKEMTAALSHEMRTPLARVRFAAAVLERDVEEKQRAQLRALNADVQQIDNLISDMLNYARLDHPGLRMICEFVPTEPWLRHALESCPPHDKTLTTGQGEIEKLWMEPRLMELALSNLVANALRHARKQVCVGVGCERNMYRIVVEDDGEGIPEADRVAVFRPYARLENGRGRYVGGFGLGLAIVARIASLHRGRVSAGVSEELGGARLVLEWPAVE